MQNPQEQPEALQRIAAYIERRKIARGIDVGSIHGFDFGRDGGIELKLSDIEYLLHALCADGWVSVATKAPPCDGETMFIGENDAGYIACFNSITPDGYCFHESAESSICVMSGLRNWKRVALPSPPDGTKEGL